MNLFCTRLVNKQTYKTMAIVAIFFMGGAWLSQKYTIGCNMSESLPQSFFVLEKREIKAEEINVGDIVYAIPPKNDYIPEGKKIIKMVGCKPGQMVDFDGKYFYCDHNVIATVQERDSKGRVMKPSSFTGVIPANKYFLMSPHEKSFDSRYFGLIDKDNLKGIALWKI